MLEALSWNYAKKYGVQKWTSNGVTWNSAYGA